MTSTNIIVILFFLSVLICELMFIYQTDIDEFQDLIKSSISEQHIFMYTIQVSFVAVYLAITMEFLPNKKSKSSKNQNDVEQMKIDLKNAIKDKTDLKYKIHQMTKSTMDVSSKNQSISKDLNVKNTQVNNLNELMILKQKELSEKDQLINHLKGKSNGSNSNNESNKIIEDLDKKMKEATKLKEESVILNSKIQTLTEENKSTQVKQRKYKDQIVALKQKVSANELIESELEEVYQLSEYQKTKIEELEKNIERYADIEQQLAEYTSNIEKQQNIENENDSIRTEFDKMLEENLELRKEIEETQSKLTRLENEHQELQSNLPNIENLEFEINKLYSDKGDFEKLQKSQNEQKIKLEEFEKIQLNLKNKEKELEHLEELKMTHSKQNIELKQQKSLNKSFVSMLEQWEDCENQTDNNEKGFANQVNTKLQDIVRENCELARKNEVLKIINRQITSKVGLDIDIIKEIEEEAKQTN